MTTLQKILILALLNLASVPLWAQSNTPALFPRRQQPVVQQPAPPPAQPAPQPQQPPANPEPWPPLRWQRQQTPQQQPQATGNTNTYVNPTPMENQAPPPPPPPPPKPRVRTYSCTLQDGATAFNSNTYTLRVRSFNHFATVHNIDVLIGIANLRTNHIGSGMPAGEAPRAQANSVDLNSGAFRVSVRIQHLGERIDNIRETVDPNRADRRFYQTDPGAATAPRSAAANTAPRPAAASPAPAADPFGRRGPVGVRVQEHVQLYSRDLRGETTFPNLGPFRTSCNYDGEMEEQMQPLQQQPQVQQYPQQQWVQPTPSIQN